METQQQVEILTRLGCQQFQGYLLGMPVNVGQLIQSQGAHFVNELVINFKITTLYNI
ncbi:EAL domain-containing protein [Acinetobacter baumannii]|nr:EAL domain-containing protein [Acinetobacter baumannii]